ncbi:hypothetical protein WG66_001623 [Moniliophthora roreri]|nr:hypothetical protein WG66_001623 [Moniliophthora roreri]
MLDLMFEYCRPMLICNPVITNLHDTVLLIETRIGLRPQAAQFVQVFVKGDARRRIGRVGGWEVVLEPVDITDVVSGTGATMEDKGGTG